MQTATEVQSESLKQVQLGQRLPRKYPARILGISFLTAIWMWAAFVRGRGYGRVLQIVFLAGALACIIVLGGLVRGMLRRRLLLNGNDSTRILAFSCTAMLLLAVFLPEYALGRPVLA